METWETPARILVSRLIWWNIFLLFLHLWLCNLKKVGPGNRISPIQASFQKKNNWKDRKGGGGETAIGLLIPYTPKKEAWKGILFRSTSSQQPCSWGERENRPFLGGGKCAICPYIPVFFFSLADAHFISTFFSKNEKDFFLFFIETTFNFVITFSYLLT